MPFQNDKKRGFSLIEVLVAISILIIAITGPMTIASRSIAQARYASLQITAFYLAQEGLEYIHLARDNNFIAGANWMTNINLLGNECKNGPCTVDPTLAPASGINACTGGCTGALYFNQATGFYGHSSGVGWTPTAFTRLVTVTDISSDEVRVNSTVTWKEHNIQRSFTLSERLKRWYPGS